ncbi:ATPase inhibitor mai-2, mitochondrial-like [Macrosteles quadrilineatus]|uniref:ATPase inhibitor mai-2, mitochondrial-like n=1 Tax=Macrosteles quadrilineatus TaxID=74068 RepID=UPI0023E17485|nr:ATPase inhibitor mai-2, mitochondrial-like [Macrosteles quadrilineatus]
MSLFARILKVTAERGVLISPLRAMSQIGDLGSGAGKGGGGGGSIRSAGGAFGKMEAANEEEYFYKQQRAQLEKLKEDLHDEISFHEEQIKRHQEAIERHKNRVIQMEQGGNK